MQPVNTSNYNYTFGAPKDWPTAERGECMTLRCVRIEHADGSCSNTSYWQPSPEELAILAAGGLVSLTVIGFGHQPVMLEAATVEAA